MPRLGLPVLLALGAALAAAGACSETTAPMGKGNVVIVDVDSSAGQQEQQGDDGGYDEVFAPVGDSGYAPPPDGYNPIGVCQMCSCPSGTYCFGGGTGFTSFDGDCHDDGAAPADGGLQLGCNPIPAACVGDGGCDCILANMEKLSCYPVCSLTQNYVYCQHP